MKSSVLSNTNSITTLNRTFSQSEQQVQAVLKSQEAVINTKTTAMFEQNSNGYALHSVNAGSRAVIRI